MRNLNGGIHKDDQKFSSLTQEIGFIRGGYRFIYLFIV